MTQYNIERYLNVQMAYGGEFLDQNRIIFLSDITGVPQVWTVELSDDGRILWPDPLTFDDNRVASANACKVDGDTRIIFARDAGGNENMQLFLMDLHGGEPVYLTQGHDAAMHLYGDWSRDGKHIVFGANRRHPGLFDLYVQALDGEARLIWQNDEPGYLFNAQFSPDGKRVAVQHMMASFDMSLYEVDVASGAVRMVTPEERGVRYYNHTYSADGRALWVLADYESDFLRLVRLDLATQQLETIVAADWNVEEFAISEDERWLAYTINAGGPSQLYLRDMQTGETRTAPLGYIPGVITGLKFAKDASKVLFTYNQATSTSDVHVWQLATDQVYPVTRASHAGLPLDSFALPEFLQYPTFDTGDDGQTRQIPAFIYKPQADQFAAPFPVVVVVHGGPESQSRPTFSSVIQYLVNNGYAVFVPNVRGSTGYGKTYSHLDDVRKRMDSVADLAHAADWIKQQPDLDGERIAVYGGSYGGFMVLSALTTYPDLWRAGVDIVGVSSFVTFLENTSEYRRKHRAAEYGTLEDDREFLDSIAPINHLDKMTASLMVIHGANDPRVPLSEAQQVVDILQKRGVTVDFLVFDDEGHGLVKLKNKLVAYPAIVRFLHEQMNGRG